MHRLVALARSYATASTRSSRLPPSKPPLSLDHFLLRQRVISLYRTIVRACHKIPPPTKEEMKKYAREEFEQHRAVEDLRKIRYLLSTGKTEFERLGKQGRPGVVQSEGIPSQASRRRAEQLDQTIPQQCSGHKKTMEDYTYQPLF
ncbi:hypothetical protein HO133_008301 [Letharia lupina]|uniref:LYR motif-containing protein 2 n=1 Tax=Letharia lupina TaxID=560253 RepID=A0A8H6CNC9_9LECA|nr:uncharacterized protein HO133_008301 [Letharia lupina]KAF6226860.1 hypothetical protein HO133_008301 [Letharia lupina]